MGNATFRLSGLAKWVTIARTATFAVPLARFGLTGARREDAASED